MSLFPTKTRLALLQAVRAGEVFLARWSTSVPMCVPGGYGRAHSVKARIAEARAAGWVSLGVDPDEYGRRYFYLTDAGRAVLDGRKT
jgi:hypothetical protein